MFTKCKAILITAFALTLLIQPGCEKKEPVADDGHLKILASFAPMYIFTANVVKGIDGVELDVLLPPGGASPHDYSMTPGDMKKLAGADALVINGLMMEAFLGDAPSRANPKLRIIVASDGIETLPDTPPEREWGASEGEGHEEGHEHGLANPHVWVSPFRAAKVVINIAEGLAQIDPANADKYRRNAESYSQRLLALGEEFKATAALAKNKKIVTVHNAFDYLAADLGLEVIAVLRVDARAEPSAAQLAQIIVKIKQAGPAGIFVEPQFSAKLAETLSAETGVPIYRLDPVDTGELGESYYIEKMRENLEVLKKALQSQ